jgi:hypothetical protein
MYDISIIFLVLLLLLLRLVNIGQVHHAHPLPSGVRVSLAVDTQDQSWFHPKVVHYQQLDVAGIAGAQLGALPDNEVCKPLNAGIVS